MEEDQENNQALPAPVRLAFRVSYLGSRFFGSQIQASERTVEGEFIEACKRLSLFEDRRKAGFQFAGRTDRGVHARGQVVAFTTTEPARATTVINTQLPPDCWCTGYARVPSEFHPRFDARSRTYRYYYSRAPDDLTAMARAAELFIGTHDFSNFARIEDKNPLRTILSIKIAEEEGFVYLEVTAESFLWHQVRCMAAALYDVGMGGDEARISRLLADETKQPLQPAPAEGLILWDTDCGIAWNPLPAGERSLAFLDHLRCHHTLMANVCRQMVR